MILKIDRPYVWTLILEEEGWGWPLWLASVDLQIKISFGGRFLNWLPNIREILNQTEPTLQQQKTEHSDDNDNDSNDNDNDNNDNIGGREEGLLQFCVLRVRREEGEGGQHWLIRTDTIMVRRQKTHTPIHEDTRKAMKNQLTGA